MEAELYNYVCLSKSYSNMEILNRSRYQHVITGCTKNEPPLETGGGILADEMGLGKTLTMLAAISRTEADANTFALLSQNGTNLNIEPNLISARATLVVVPSPRRISIQSLILRMMIVSNNEQCYLTNGA